MLEFQKKQLAFAAHIRGPEKHPEPVDIESRRMKIYRDLFFNNVEGFIAGTFPVFKSLFEQDGWNALVRDFLEQHRCATPYFLEICEEFLEYLSNPELAVHQTFPFAYELCHYEWVELAIDIGDDDPKDFDANADLIANSIILAANVWPLAYQWAVHNIGPEQIPMQQPEQPTCLVVYRNRQQDVAFLEANPVTLRLLEILQAQAEGEETQLLTGEQVIQQLAQEMQYEPAKLLEFAQPLFAQLQALGIILGARIQ